MNRLRKTQGYTLIELLIALIATGIIATAGFQFYVKMHNSTMAQEEISDMQQSSRASLERISKSIRMAGFKIGSHPAYRINGESLYVFASISQPVDTILYFLADYDNTELVGVDSLDASVRPRKLMIQVNSGAAEVFADNIHSMHFRVINPTTLYVALTVQPSKSDESFASNEGYRMYTANERVKMRNLGI
jgi:prepilin-type N-terminal cleavage/methylation domain-containing protein